MLALLSVFSLILLYPFGLVGERDAEAGTYRALFFTILATAAGVARLGLAERTWWNGRILWFYLPMDWLRTQAGELPRASGPFVDPDHFADYLAMVLLLAATGVLFSFPLVTSRHRSDLKLLCAAAAFLILSAVVLSLSRGGWIVAGLGASGALALSFARARERAPAFVQRLGMRAVPLALAGFASLMLIVLFMIGPSARSEAGVRLGVTLARGENLQYRPAVWQDTLAMIAHFPAFGVGLGCWPEIFPHYQRPPWMSFFFREAENDYLQFIAETGLVGLALLICFAYGVIRKLSYGALALPARQLPLFAGLISGLGAAILHEGFDFSMHTPANALLFTILLALALRIALTEANKQTIPRLRKVAEGSQRMYFGTACTALIAILSIIAACAQDGRAYPYGIESPTSLAMAEESLVEHPAVSTAHLKLATMIHDPAAAELQRRQLWAAIWLDPNNPDARDFYAKSLFIPGEKRAALEQISLSVYRAPDRGKHYYLNEQLIPWLLP
jgi:O-antigen ligase